MEKTTKFQVGDKVICGYNIGTITHITEKRKDIKVDFGTYTDVFNSRGWTRGDIWSARHIDKWTPEGQKEIDDKIAVNKCRDLFEKTNRNNKLTPDMAREIIEILSRKEET